MKLPPSIDAIFREYVGPEEEVPEVVWRLLHEACRLQRDADCELATGWEHDAYPIMKDAPLVVVPPD